MGNHAENTATGPEPKRLAPPPTTQQPLALSPEQIVAHNLHLIAQGEVARQTPGGIEGIQRTAAMQIAIALGLPINTATADRITTAVGEGKLPPMGAQLTDIQTHFKGLLEQKPESTEDK